MTKDRIRKYFLSKCCAVSMIAITAIGTMPRASAQTSPADFSFEVATIKPVDPSHPFDGSHFWAHVNSAGASYWSMNINDLFTYAYGVKAFQVTGPEWTSSDRYDIEAKFFEGADKKDDRRMLQALLKNRFKLSFHVQKKELTGYGLVVGKHGGKLTSSLPNPKKDTSKFDEHGVMHYESDKMTMDELAGNLHSCLGNSIQKIENMTGITGTYQVVFDCPLRTEQSWDDGGQDGSVLTRSLDALGLKLEKRKFMQDVYMIDHVEKPSDN